MTKDLRTNTAPNSIGGGADTSAMSSDVFSGNPRSWRAGCYGNGWESSRSFYLAGAGLARRLQHVLDLNTDAPRPRVVSSLRYPSDSPALQAYFSFFTSPAADFSLDPARNPSWKRKIRRASRELPRHEGQHDRHDADAPDHVQRQVPPVRVLVQRELRAPVHTRGLSGRAITWYHLMNLSFSFM